MDYIIYLLDFFFLNPVASIIYVVIGLIVAASPRVIAVRVATFDVILEDRETGRKYTWGRHTKYTPLTSTSVKYITTGGGGMHGEK